MSNQPKWMGYVDLLAKIAIPVAIFFATNQYNNRQASAHAEENCLDLQLRVFSLACSDSACTVSNQKANALLGVDNLIEARCQRAGISPVAQIKQALANAGSQVSDAKLSAALQDASGAPPPQKAAPVATPPPLAPQTAVAAPAVSRSGYHIYVQILSEAQRPAGRVIVDRLSHSTFGNAPLLADGPELVPNYALSHTELRCLKKADCANAYALAAYIAVQLGTQISVRDLSARYESAARVKPGTFELWFASNFIEGPAAAAFTTQNAGGKPGALNFSEPGNSALVAH